MISAKLNPPTSERVPKSGGGAKAKFGWKTTRSPQKRNFFNTWIHEIKINKFENTSHFQVASISKSETKFKVLFCF